MQKTVFSLYLK